MVGGGDKKIGDRVESKRVGGGGVGRVVTGDKNYVCRDRIFLSG